MAAAPTLPRITVEQYAVLPESEWKKCKPGEWHAVPTDGALQAPDLLPGFQLPVAALFA